MNALLHAQIDARGRRIKSGDYVRIVGVPELRSKRHPGRKEMIAAFEYLVGTVRRIRGFDRNGFAEIFFRVRGGHIAGWHGVVIEPCLLLKQRRRHRAT
jgi:hypothetical protein